MDLPTEVLISIGDFLGPGHLSETCTMASELLRGRHLRWGIRSSDLSRPLQMLVAMSEAIHTLRLRCQGEDGPPEGLEALVLLSSAPALFSLSLCLKNNGLEEVDAERLAALYAAPALHTLSLELGNNFIRAGGAEALARLGSSAVLHTLHLKLKNNDLTAAGAKALSALKDANALCTLTLDLASNDLGVGVCLCPPPSCPHAIPPSVRRSLPPFLRLHCCVPCSFPSLLPTSLSSPFCRSPSATSSLSLPCPLPFQVGSNSLRCWARAHHSSA